MFNGYKLLSALTTGFKHGEPVNSYVRGDALDTCSFNHLDLDDRIDCIRQLISVMAPGNQHAFDIAHEQLRILRGQRDKYVLAEARRTSNVIDFQETIAVVVASGLLHNAGNVEYAFRLALDVCVLDPSMRSYYKEQLALAQISASSIRRNRMIVHMAICLQVQEELEKVAARGTYMAFRTLDLTPERGFEWVFS